MQQFTGRRGGNTRSSTRTRKPSSPLRGGTIANSNRTTQNCCAKLQTRHPNPICDDPTSSRTLIFEYSITPNHDNWLRTGSGKWAKSFVVIYRVFSQGLLATYLLWLCNLSESFIFRFFNFFYVYCLEFNHPLVSYVYSLHLHRLIIYYPLALYLLAV